MSASAPARRLLSTLAARHHPRLPYELATPALPGHHAPSGPRQHSTPAERCLIANSSALNLSCPATSASQHGLTATSSSALPHHPSTTSASQCHVSIPAPHHPSATSASHSGHTSAAAFSLSAAPGLQSRSTALATSALTGIGAASWHHMKACGTASWHQPGARGLATSAGAGGEGSPDVAIVGGGIVGIATAREIVERYPKARVTVVEKEKEIMAHQSSHNSGVIHAGLYYEPGSDMARLCVEGAERMYAYCAQKHIPHSRVGKLVVATSEPQIPLLHDLYNRAVANGVKGLELIGPEKIRELEPNIQALRALHSPNTGIADYPAAGRQMATDFLESGRGSIITGFELAGVIADESKGVELHAKDSSRKPVRARWLITCAGLHADKVGKLAGGATEPMVLPFRGTYHELKPEFRHLITRNIYPVPDPRFPMVGVHLTPRTDGRVLIGPNAALAMKMEGYKFLQLDIRDMLRFATNVGLWKLVLRNLPIVTGEIWRDVNARAFVAEAQRYCPSLKLEQTMPGWSGVHAVAVSRDGKIIGEFLFENTASGVVLNVRNAPSPAATSSLAIASAVVNRAAKDFGWPSPR